MYDDLRCAECSKITDLAGTCPGMPHKWNERKGLVQTQRLDFTTYYRWEKKFLESVIPTQKQEKGECDAPIVECEYCALHESGKEAQVSLF